MKTEHGGYAKESQSEAQRTHPVDSVDEPQVPRARAFVFPYDSGCGAIARSRSVLGWTGHGRVVTPRVSAA